jgi:hypothetical protein
MECVETLGKEQKSETTKMDELRISNNYNGKTTSNLLLQALRSYP